jgi:hypothetical protein
MERDDIDPRWTSKALGEIMSAFSDAKPMKIDDIKDDTLSKRCRMCEYLFTTGTIHLREMGNPIIKNLMINIWGIYHNRHVVMAMGPDVPALSIAVIERRGVVQALTFAPYAWPEMVEADPTMELGAIVVVGSQAVDFYNNRLTSPDESKISKERSLSYEAELLILFREMGHSLNGYQKDVLTKYPNGFDSSFAYPMKAVNSPGSAS